MNAKIMLLPSNATGEKLCSYAENCLTEIACAFGHSFTLLREKIGERSVQEYGTALTTETVDACRKCDAIVVGDSSSEGLETLAAELELPLQLRIAPEFIRPGEHGPVIARVMSLNQELLSPAVKAAFETARRENLPLVHAAPSGSGSNNWHAAVKVQAERFPQVNCLELPADRTLSFLLEQPQEVGVLLCPPYIGRMYLAAFASACSQPSLLFDAVKGKKKGLYAAVQKNRVENAGNMSPLGIILAVCELLRDTLQLEREADCLFSAAYNVYQSGWRTGDMSGDGELTDGEKIMGLIRNQIELASQFV